MRRALAVLSVLAAAPVSAQTVVKLAAGEAAELPEFRDRLQSALLESGVIRLSTVTAGRDVPAPQLTVTVRVHGQGMTASHASAQDYCVGGTRLAAVADFRVRDARSGAVIAGGDVTKGVEVGSHVVAGDSDCSTMTPYLADYGRLTTALAVAVARRIAFQVAPLRVASAEGRTVVLNHGGALVPLGAIVQIASVSGTPVRYRVVDSTPATAGAEPMGTPAEILPGAIAQVIEDDDPAANARRFNKVELP